MMSYVNAPETEHNVQTSMPPIAEFTTIGGAVSTFQSILKGQGLIETVTDIASNKIKIGKIEEQIPISNIEAEKIVYGFEGQIYKQEIKKGDEFVVNHTGGNRASGHYVIEKKDANKTPEELQRDLALPKGNEANAQTVIKVKEDHTILSGKAADKSNERWAYDHATGGGKQKVINPDKTDINEVF